MSIKPTFSGEVQFRRYSDTSTQGVQITLALHDREALEPLIHKAGKRFMCVLVELGDDEMPVEPPAEKVKVGPLCREAVGYCEMPAFWDWLTTERFTEGDEQSAKSWLLHLCDISSRKELDTDRQAGQDFVNLVRVPFMRWMKQRQPA